MAKHISHNFKLLLITSLYSLQGIPQGFSNLLILLLHSANSSYFDLAIFSLTYYPYTFKICWSPIVDAVFSPKVGRRKSWILPMQFTMGLLFILLGSPARWLCADFHHSESVLEALIARNRIFVLTAIFSLLFFCTSTQDIALDAWALQLLPSEAKHLASTCQTAGLNIGNALGYNAVILLTSERAGVKRTLTLGRFCLFFGAFALLLNAAVMLFVAEKSVAKQTTRYSVRAAYSSLLKMVCNPRIRAFSLVVLTSVFPFAANMYLLNAYAISRDIASRDQIAVLDLLSVLLSLIASRHLATYQGDAFLRAWHHFSRMRLWVSGALSALIVLVSGSKCHGFLCDCGTAIAAVVYVLFSALDKVLFILYFAFCSKVCDETYGGTYLTFLAIVYNFGHVWAKNAVFGVFDVVSEYFDGYVGLSVVCFLGGVVWGFSVGNAVEDLNDSEVSEWRVRTKLE